MKRCKNCGKEIRNSKWNQIYCNDGCREESYDNKNQLIKKQNPCAICGFWRFTESHHIIKQIDYGSDNNNNLIQLCPNHHKMADSYRYGNEFLKLLKKKTGKCGEMLKDIEIMNVKNHILNILKEKDSLNARENTWAFNNEMRILIQYGELYSIAHNRFGNNKEVGI
jgi:hypothetical protein